MLKIIENEDIGATQVVNEMGLLVAQWSWATYHRTQAYQEALMNVERTEAYRAEKAKFGYTRGVRRGMDD